MDPVLASARKEESRAKKEAAKSSKEARAIRSAERAAVIKRAYDEMKSRRLSLDQKRERKRQHNKNYKHRLRAAKRGSVANATASQIRAARAKAKGVCHYCRKKFKALTIDHITPIAAGGTHTLDNIVFACHACNSEKRDLPAADYARKHGLLLV